MQQNVIDNQIEEFFDAMVAEYMDERMIKFINMASFRSEFIIEVNKARIHYELQERGEVERGEDFEICEDILFWFNRFDPTDVILEAEGKIYDFVQILAGVKTDEDVEDSDQIGSEDIE